MDSIPVVAVAFGTSTEARNTYAFFEECFRERFPETELLWAFTSRILREKAHQTPFTMNSLDDVLQRCKQHGYKRVVVQSLHIIPGIEFEKITEAVRNSPIKIKIGLPLLSTDEDIIRTVCALEDRFPPQGDCAAVLVGHGTHHPAGAAYQTIARLLKERYGDTVLISVVEGEPSWETAREVILKRGIKKIRFIPLMFVAGDHMLNDVLGEESEDDELSWKMQLPGVEIDGTEKGLGFNLNIIDIYLQHLEAARRTIS
jgi:sirohydrochlorin cobaltochelatase